MYRLSYKSASVSIGPSTPFSVPAVLGSSVKQYVCFLIWNQFGLIISWVLLPFSTGYCQRGRTQSPQYCRGAFESNYVFLAVFEWKTFKELTSGLRNRNLSFFNLSENPSLLQDFATMVTFVPNGTIHSHFPLVFSKSLTVFPHPCRKVWDIKQS